MSQTVAQAIANACQAARNCASSGNAEWLNTWSERLDAIERDVLPSGSGFDAGTRIDRDKTDGLRIVLTTSFHHMNDVGYYEGWTEHTVTLRPDFVLRMSITVSGSNRNDIKDHIAETFLNVLDAEHTA